MAGHQEPFLIIGYHAMPINGINYVSFSRWRSLVGSNIVTDAKRYRVQCCRYFLLKSAPSAHVFSNAFLEKSKSYLDVKNCKY